MAALLGPQPDDRIIVVGRYGPGWCGFLGGSMLRLGVVIWLIGVTVAGPWLCCCTAMRRAANLFASRPAEAARPEVAACCRHHDPGEEARAPSPGCPCKKGADRDMVASVSAADRIAPDSLAPVALLPASGGVLSSPELTPTRQAALPFWPSGDLIHLCHHLRC
jgi:hypothetical protein